MVEGCNFSSASVSLWFARFVHVLITLGIASVLLGKNTGTV